MEVASPSFSPSSESHPYVNVKTQCGGRTSSFLSKRPSAIVCSDLADVLTGPEPDQNLDECPTSLPDVSFVDESVTTVTTRKQETESCNPLYYLAAMLLTLLILIVAFYVNLLAALTAAFSVVTVSWWLQRLPTNHKAASRKRNPPREQKGETAEYLEALFQAWWTNLSPTMYTLVKDKVDPILKKGKPSALKSLKLRRFILGDRVLLRSVRDVRAVHGPRGATLEADVCVESENFRAVLRAQTRHVEKDVDLVLEALELRCKVRVQLGLDRSQPAPHVAHTTLSLTEPPLVWFSAAVDTNLLGLPVKMGSARLAAWLSELVVDHFLAGLVVPAKIDVTLTKASKA